MSEVMVEEVRRCRGDAGGEVIDGARECDDVRGDGAAPSHRKAGGKSIVCECDCDRGLIVCAVGECAMRRYKAGLRRKQKQS